MTIPIITKARALSIQRWMEDNDPIDPDTIWELCHSVIHLQNFVDEIDHIHNHWDGGHGLGLARDEIGRALFELRFEGGEET